MLFGKSITSQLTDLIKEAEKSNNLEKEFSKLCKIANDFFKSKYGVTYRFTYEDMKNELKQKNLPEALMLEKVCDSLGELEFNKTKIRKENIIDISKDLQNLSEGKIRIEPIILKDEMFAPPQLVQTTELSDLPLFSNDLNNEVSDLLDNLNKNKEELQNELKIIEEEKDVLKKEKLLPKFKGNKKVDSELAMLEEKKRQLEKKEAHIDEKLTELRSMEYEITQHAEKLKNDDKTLRDKEDFILSKEKIIEEIRKDFKEKYKETLKEIEDIKKDLDEKEKNFLELQKFYQNREDRLSIEESNLLEEKRNYGKVVKNLINNHLEIATQDLKKVELDLEVAKKRDKQLNASLDESIKKIKKLIAEKDLIKKGIEGKKKYFTDLEKDFSKKDIEFQALEKELTKREDKAIKFETKLADFNTHIEEAEDETRKKMHELELKELDLMALEKQIKRLNFEMKNHELRLQTREKYLQKRIESFEGLKKDIKNQISREKRAVQRIEERLRNKGLYVGRKLKEVENLEENYDSLTKESFTTQKTTLSEYDVPGQILKEIKVTHLPDTRIGNPNVLDILRLLNISRDLLNNNMADKSRDAYMEIEKLFEELREDDKDELYSMITEVFRTKGEYGNEISKKIQSLITQFKAAVARGDMVSSGHIYSMLQQKYFALPKEEKSRYYNMIMELYDKATATAG